MASAPAWEGVGASWFPAVAGVLNEPARLYRKLADAVVESRMSYRL